MVPGDEETIEIKVVDVEENQSEGTIKKNIDSEEQALQIKVEGTNIEAEREKVNGTVIRSQFKQFDFVCSAAVDEKGITYNSTYNASSSPSSNQQINRSGGVERHNRIMQEWKILKMGLPDSTYVRVYENDVARVAIIGGAGTPYRDGLFFFDVILPLNYPSVPPEVRCYYEFTLCKLSGAGIDRFRIDTRWPTYESQKPLVAKWNPNASTILDILLSIQFVFQTENPYFSFHGMNMNNPRLQEAIKIGYKLDESFDCNESLFKANCWSMLATLKYPPKDFEEFVAQHFRDRAEAILTACNPYRIKCGNHPRYETKMCREYRDSMVNVYSKLLKAFIKNGSSLDEFVGDINLDEDDSGYVEKLTCDEVLSLSVVAFILICVFGGLIVGIIQAINGTLS
ncbi:hypothetical protein MKW98_001967 [Papaver atlanticum]|uniref:UBC core domain-containing protein n=1 Tax=Papaver atlanticum TaxID=357466 RepID=A0AAD4XGE4_9MAGN|nr:hypothetical protein MKW98_001967 [Papaver atlanticum]